MIDNAINGDKMLAGGGEDMILACRCKIIRQIGSTAWRWNSATRI